LALGEQEQMRVYILCQKVLFESPNLDKMLQYFQVLANVFSYDVEDEKLKKEILAQIKKVKDFRNHKIIRKQDEIMTLKIECDDLTSKMMHCVDGKVMQMCNAFDMN